MKRSLWTKHKKNKIYIASLIIYTIIIHILQIEYFGKAFKMSYHGMLYPEDFNKTKYLLAIAITIPMLYSAIKKIDCERLAEKIQFLLMLLYFIPGVVQQAVLNAEYAYMIYYFVFWLGMEIWMLTIKPRKKSILGNKYHAKQPQKYINALTILACLTIAFVLFYSNTSLSISNFMSTFSDVYGIRAAAKEAGMHWTIVTLEYWARYFLMLMIAYYVEKKKYLISVILLIMEALVFMIQANRVVLFLAGVCLVLGFFKADNTKLSLALVTLAIIVLIEVNIKSSGMMLTDIFRRFSVVPNRMGEHYFDYFLKHTPDLLRTKYPRIIRFLGIPSPYKSPTIGEIIAMEYYGVKSNFNNGLVGAGMFMFGLVGPVFTTFGYVMGFRLFEGVTYGLRGTKTIPALAVLLATLSVNMGAFLTGIFSISYLMLLYLCMIPLNKERETISSTGE